MGRRAFTIRMDEDEAEEIKRVAKVDGTSVAGLFRQAIRELVDRRRQNPEFQERLRELIEKNQEILKRLDD